MLIQVSVAVFDGAAVQRTWTGLSAAFLSVSFIFGNAIRTLFENALYLFQMNPFDIGWAFHS
jgi:hypothetical protein